MARDNRYSPRGLDATERIGAGADRKADDDQRDERRACRTQRVSNRDRGLRTVDGTGRRAGWHCPAGRERSAGQARGRGPASSTAVIGGQISVYRSGSDGGPWNFLLGRHPGDMTYGRPDALDAEIVGAGKGAICLQSSGSSATVWTRCCTSGISGGRDRSGAGNPVGTSRWSSGQVRRKEGSIPMVGKRDRSPSAGPALGLGVGREGPAHRPERSADGRRWPTRAVWRYRRSQWRSPHALRRGPGR
jgi:hypothetical protein